jgi:hypothetical protein
MTLCKARTPNLARLPALLGGGLLLIASACEALPGEKRQQGAVIGGASGAAAGAVLADEDHRLLGAVIGGVLGAGGGYLIGREMEGREEAAPVDSQRGKFTSEQVRAARTADIDSDGNVTLAEIVAMEAAGLDDNEIVRRLEATTMVFALNDEQEKTLRDRGVSQTVIARLETLNRKPDQVSAPGR